MSLPSIVARASYSDAAGIYIAYTYSDGHIETDPPNRPVSKEDLQRQIRDSLAQEKAKQSLANDRARFTKSTAQAAAPNAQQIARAEFDIINSGLVTRPLSSAIRNFTTFAPTATANDGQIDQLISNVPLGGEVGDSAVAEFVPPAAIAANQQNHQEGYAIARKSLELVREK